MKPLSARQRQVLQATVHHYVDTIEPVGSRTLVQRFGIPASSATVRSAMGVLEQRGLLTQPHTSAGRVPSPLGYRHYVDCLLPEPGAAVQLLERELAGLSLRWAALATDPLTASCPVHVCACMPLTCYPYSGARVGRNLQLLAGFRVGGPPRHQALLDARTAFRAPTTWE